jgi:hypothetical protein
MAIKSCGITGLGSGRLVDGLGNGGSFAVVVFAVGFAFVAVFGFAFACAIGFDLCGGFVFLAEDGFFATGFFVAGFFFATVFVCFAMIISLSFRHLWWR